MNPLFKQLGNGTQGGGMHGGFGEMIRQFQQFKASFQGDPEQAVKRLLQSGRMTQAQLDQLQQAAQMFQNLINE